MQLSSHAPVRIDTMTEVLGMALRKCGCATVDAEGI